MDSDLDTFAYTQLVELLKRACTDSSGLRRIGIFCLPEDDTDRPCVTFRWKDESSGQNFNIEMRVTDGYVGDVEKIRKTVNMSTYASDKSAIDACFTDIDAFFQNMRLRANLVSDGE